MLQDDVGFMSEVRQGMGRGFLVPAWVQLNMSNVSVLQACAVWFSEDKLDGIPLDFTVEVMQGGAAYATKNGDE